METKTWNSFEEGYRPKPGPNPPKAPPPDIKFPFGETGLVRPPANGARRRPSKKVRKAVEK
jgi:hypothetical protein